MSSIVRDANNEEVSDESLMGCYADGDLEAFEELFARYEPRAYAFFLRRTASPDRAEDLYQELFLRIHRARNRYDPDRPFAPWFFKIANHLLVDDRRRAFRSHETAVDNDSDRAPSPDATSEECIAQREQVAQVLEVLTPDEQYILVSAKVEGVGYTELANRLGKSVDAVKKIASRATIRIRSGGLFETPY